MTLFGRLKRAFDALVGPDDAPRPTRRRRDAEHPDADAARADRASSENNELDEQPSHPIDAIDLIEKSHSDFGHSDNSQKNQNLGFPQPINPISQKNENLLDSKKNENSPEPVSVPATPVRSVHSAAAKAPVISEAHTLSLNRRQQGARYGITPTSHAGKFSSLPAADVIRAGIRDPAVAAATIDLAACRYRPATNDTRTEQLNRHWFGSEYVLINNVNTNDPSAVHVAGWITDIISRGTVSIPSMKTLLSLLKQHVMDYVPDTNTFDSPLVKAVLMGAKERQSGREGPKTTAIPPGFIIQVLHYAMVCIESFEKREWKFHEQWISGNRSDRYGSLADQGYIFATVRGEKDPGITIQQVREFRDAVLVCVSYLYCLRGVAIFDLVSSSETDESPTSNIWLRDDRVFLSLTSMKNRGSDILRSEIPRAFPKGITGNKLATIVRAWFTIRDRVAILVNLGTETGRWCNYPGQEGVTSRGKNAASIVANSLNHLLQKFPYEPPPGGKFTGHSLRKGCATAMYAAGVSIDTIKWWGFWQPKSANCEQTYLQHNDIHTGGEEYARDARLLFGDFVQRDNVASLLSNDHPRFLNEYQRYHLYKSEKDIRRWYQVTPLTQEEMRQRLRDEVDALRNIDADDNSIIPSMLAYGTSRPLRLLQIPDLADYLQRAITSTPVEHTHASETTAAPSPPRPSQTPPTASTDIGAASPHSTQPAELVPQRPVVDEPASPAQRNMLFASNIDIRDSGYTWKSITRNQARRCIDDGINAERVQAGLQPVLSDYRLRDFYDPSLRSRSIHNIEPGSITTRQCLALRTWCVTEEEINRCAPPGIDPIRDIRELSSMQAHELIRACIADSKARQDFSSASALPNARPSSLPSSSVPSSSVPGPSVFRTNAWESPGLD